MKEPVTKVCAAANDALKAIGLPQIAKVVDENLTGDEGMDGYVLLEGIAIYPQEVDGIYPGVGWGVCAETIIPGCHTMPNGDPGYPDEPDVVDIVMPYVEPKTMVGSLRFPRTANDAVACAVRAAVDGRLRDWQDYGGGDERDDSADVE
jgi:hypothetical protein